PAERAVQDGRAVLHRRRPVLLRGEQGAGRPRRGGLDGGAGGAGAVGAGGEPAGGGDGGPHVLRVQGAAAAVRGRGGGLPGRRRRFTRRRSRSIRTARAYWIRSSSTGAAPHHE